MDLICADFTILAEFHAKSKILEKACQFRDNENQYTTHYNMMCDIDIIMTGSR